MALYSLFRKVSEPGMRPRYARVDGAGAYPKASAIRIFQDRLIGSAFSAQPLELRMVRAAKPSLLPASEQMCSPCAAHIHTRCIALQPSGGNWCQCNCRANSGKTLCLKLAYQKSMEATMDVEKATNLL